MRHRLSLANVATLALGIVLCSTFCPLTSLAAAQLPASAPKDDPVDTRFQEVTEDWNTPALSGSHLTAVPPSPPLIDNSHADYTVEVRQLQWRHGDPLDLYIILPTGIRNPPVILNLYGYPTDTDPYRHEVFQKELIKDGFAAVGFVSALTRHRYHDRPMKEWFLSELQESLATSAHDVQMILNYLAARGDLDMNRVGMFGQGSGATIAILASAADPRIKILDVLDPWGDWPAWIGTSPFVPDDERADYIKADFLKKAATMETLQWLPKVQARQFRLQQLIFESDTPLPIKEKLRAALPPGTAIKLYKSLEEFKAAFPNSANLDWMKNQLRSLSDAPAAGARR